MGEFGPHEDLLGYARLCLIANDMCAVLNRPHQALWHAKFARYIMENVDSTTYRNDPGMCDYLTINAFFAEAVSYSRLALYQEALVRCNAVSELDVLEIPLAFWRPSIMQVKMTALAHLPRFSITEVEYLADGAKAAVEHTSNEIAPLWLLSNGQALAIAYMRREKYKRAAYILEAELDRAEIIPLIGASHKVKLLRTCARLRMAMGDDTGWQGFIHKAMNLATEAGLSRELSEIELEVKQHTLSVS